MSNVPTTNISAPMTPDEVRDFKERLESGDETTVPLLQKVLQHDPKILEQIGGDLSKNVEKRLVTNAVGKDLLLREALLRKLELLRQELAGSKVTPLEKLLIDRIVCCWLLLYHAEFCLLQAKDMTIPHGDYYQRRIDRLHRRYLSAIKMLAVVRRLAPPVLRVNLSDRVNQHNGANGVCPKPSQNGLPVGASHA